MSDPFNSSPIPSSAHTRVVDADIEAICAAGRTVSLRLATKHGIEVFHVSRKNFIDKAQSPGDHHGHPFRSAQTDLQALESDAAQVPITKGNSVTMPLPGSGNHYGTGGLPIDLRRALRLTYDAKKRGEDQRSQKEIAAAVGCCTSTVNNYFATFSANDAANTGAVPPYMKPNGKIL